jgi:hypothetical protein
MRSFLYVAVNYFHVDDLFWHEFSSNHVLLQGFRSHWQSSCSNLYLKSSRTAVGGQLLSKSPTQSPRKKRNHRGLKDCAIALWRIGSFIPRLRFSFA